MARFAHAAAMRFALGFLLAAIGAILWVWVDARNDGEAISIAGTALIALGLLLAALGGRPATTASGLGVATLGMGLFMVPIDWFVSVAAAATLSFFAGLVGAAVQSSRVASGRVAASAMALPLAIAAFGSFLWVISDLMNDGWAWQPGNVLAGVGLAMEAARPSS